MKDENDNWKEDIPLGWVSIEEHLPMCVGTDVLSGGTPYKVRDYKGNEDVAYILDHNTWYYLAKEEGIVEWHNDKPIEPMKDKQTYAIVYWMDKEDFRKRGTSNPALLAKVKVITEMFNYTHPHIRHWWIITDKN